MLDGARQSLSSFGAVRLEMSLAPLYDGETLMPQMTTRLNDAGFDLAGRASRDSWKLGTHRLLQVDGVFFLARLDVSTIAGISADHYDRALVRCSREGDALVAQEVRALDTEAAAASRPGAKGLAERLLPTPVLALLDRLVFLLRRTRIRTVQRMFGMLGFNVVKEADYYSTLPVLKEIEQNRSRWDRPSPLTGLDIDVDAMRARLSALADRWESDFTATAGDYRANQERGFGPGYPAFDARTLYYSHAARAQARRVPRGRLWLLSTLLRNAGG